MVIAKDITAHAAYMIHIFVTLSAEYFIMVENETAASGMAIRLAIRVILMNVFRFLVDSNAKFPHENN